MPNFRSRSSLSIALVFGVAFVLYTTYFLRSPSDAIHFPSSSAAEYPAFEIDQPIPPTPPTPPTPPEPPIEPEKPQEPEKQISKPVYKPDHTSNFPPTVDNFPLLSSTNDVPPVPAWNLPPSPHVPESTPLLIGFTRNWRLLQQTIISYLTAGWPASDIYVIENTGVMKSNKNALLSLQNPFFLNHTRLGLLGVNVVSTPTLLSFSQLQNYFIWMAVERGWETYFWGHMDAIAMSEEPAPEQYPSSNTSSRQQESSLYMRAVSALRSTALENDPNSSNSSKPWAARFFAYDRLALVNRRAYESIGGWDTAIPYYYSDCDMHDRLKMYGWEYNEEDVRVGNVSDVAGSLDDLLVLYRKKGGPDASFEVDRPRSEEMREITEVGKIASKREEWIDDEPRSAAYLKLLEVVDEMREIKGKGNERNTWQARQGGGKGEPYYRDPEGFEQGIKMTTQTGRDIYAEKWGHKECGLLQVGRQAGDEWRLEHDWD